MKEKPEDFKLAERVDFPYKGKPREMTVTAICIHGIFLQDVNKEYKPCDYHINTSRFVPIKKFKLIKVQKGQKRSRSK